MATKLGFGRRSQSQQEIADYRDKLKREAEAAAAGGSERFKFKDGDNLFWLMPPLSEDMAEPFRAIRVHYGPFSPCGGHPPIFHPESESKKDRVQHVARVRDCERCTIDWEEFGYDARGGGDKAAWEKSAKHTSFEASKAKDKVIFSVIPMTDMYEVSRQKKSLKETKVTLEKKAGAEKRFAGLMRKYGEFIETDGYKESIKDGMENAALLKYKRKDTSEEFEWGVATIVFSFFSWNDVVYPEIEEAIRFGELPWGTDDNGGVPAILNIRKSGKGRDTTYGAEVIIVPEEERLTITEEFLSVLEQSVPDISALFPVPPKAKMLEEREAYHAARRAASTKEETESFGDDDDDLPPVKSAKKSEKTEPPRRTLKAPTTKKVEEEADEDFMEDTEVDEDDFG